MDMAWLLSVSPSQPFEWVHAIQFRKDLALAEDVRVAIQE
jgi:hypothetical protein